MCALILKSSAHLWRQRIVKPADVCDFSSNDYLSITQDKNLQKAYQQGFSQYPIGSTASMLISGYHVIHQEFEAQFCDAYNADAAILFTSGYAANLAITAFLGKVSCIALFDKAIHASIYDGIKLSCVKYKRFAHQNYDMLRKIASSIDENTILLVESVYSMGGHFTPLDKVYNTVSALKGMIVDEAHAFGLYGREGLGGIEHFKLSCDDVPLRVIPLGKALGAMGAMIVGKKDWIEAVIQTARSYIYSTGISPAYVYGMQKAFTMLRQADEKRARLFNLIAYFRLNIKQCMIDYNNIYSQQLGFRRGANEVGWALAQQTYENERVCSRLGLGPTNTTKFVWIDSETPIQHLCLGCPQKALEISAYLLQNGFFVRAIRAPTVPKVLSGIRIVLNTQHTEKQIDTLLSLISSHKSNDYE